MRAFVLAAFTMAAVPAAATAAVIYKCVADNGKVTYSESPCYGETWHRLGAPTPEKPAAREPVESAIQPSASPPPPAPKGTGRPRVVKLPTPP